jgi:hypothetical protein
VLEDCNSSQPLIMGSRFKVEDIATPMALLFELEDFRNVGIPSTSSIIYLSAPSTSHRVHLFNFFEQIFHGV